MQLADRWYVWKCILKRGREERPRAAVKGIERKGKKGEIELA